MYMTDRTDDPFLLPEERGAELVGGDGLVAEGADVGLGEGLEGGGAHLIYESMIW